MIKRLRIFTVALANAGTGRNASAKIVLTKAEGTTMEPTEVETLLQDLRSRLSEEDMAAVLKLVEVAKRSEPEKPVVEKADGEPEKPVVEKADGEPEQPEPDDMLRKAQSSELAVAKAELAAMKAELARRDETAAVAGFVAKASAEMAAIPGCTPGELGLLLKSVSDHVDDAAMAKLVAILRGASQAIAKSALLKAAGSDGDEQDAASQLQLEINKLRKVEPALSPEQALYRVSKTNSRLFKAACESEVKR